MINSVLKIIQGWVNIKGATDGTNIGNNGDSLHTHVTNLLNTTIKGNTDGTIIGNSGDSLNTNITNTVTAIIPLGVDVNNFPAVQVVSVSNFPVTQNVIVDNFPGTQNISGSVSVSNFPASQAVTGTFFQATQPVSAASLPLPLGAATETTLSTMSAKLPATLGQKTMANSLAVVVASDQSTLPTISNDLYIVGAANSAAGNNLFNAAAGPGATDAINFKSGTVQIITSATTGNFTFQHSNDNVNFQPMPVFRVDSATPNAVVTAITPTASQFIYHFPIKARYIRCNVTSTMNATAVAHLRLSQESWSPIVPNVVNATAANLNATVSGSLSSAGTVTQPTASSLNATAVIINGQITDIGSAAITTTQTSSAFSLVAAQSMSLAIFVTAISGVGAAMDVVLQQSHDGINFYDWYAFERITATGQYYSPTLRVTGQQYRIIRTVSGTTPSITSSVSRLSKGTQVPEYRRIFSRTIDPNTLNSASTSLLVESVSTLQMIVSSAAGATVNPVIKMQGSEDNLNWYDLNGMSITATPSTTLTIDSLDNVAMPKFIRAIVGTAGTGAVLNYVSIKGSSRG